jgi:spore maturation protein CgeB
MRSLSSSLAPLPSVSSGYEEQIKGRNFEVPGCGGFMLTGWAENLEDYYVVGEEVVCFDQTAELIEKVRYYLDHEAERQAIARAGYERTLREHTYAHRFAEIFRQVGLAARSGASAPEDVGRPGRTEEIC